MLHMTPTILKNFFSKSATRLYPVKKREPFDNVRGELDIRIEDCIFCSSCRIKCPAACIEVDKKNKIWQIDPYICVYCGICVDHCPTKCLYFKGDYRAPVAEKAMKIEQKREETQSK
ncbi:4Fe-4S binding protein [Desulfohalobiaceae bacterium Ax17]|jgi:ech hydrogenase subunit F|uniref:4Fe-4S dicluster domain-containing protein n=1 Tax=Desulfovulcanus ferrireducens TaxID=2831190 RepID=UPI00207BC79A|nr:4Fe-4S dicluster domain-containing protein [Desulfovulcanus ferrireducens]MBT8764119.1 4Fe-4S binding protein [Desulfovulcanus ferrireducens]